MLPTSARRLLGLLSDDVVEFWGRQVDATFALDRILARVVAVEAETPRVRSLVLRPNRNWRGFRAGQHVLLTVEIDGRRLTRAFSLSGAEDDPTLRLTIGRRPGGRVTPFVHDRVQPGAVVELGHAGGEFVLPADPGVPLLFVAGGTGVTPFLSMLRTMAARGEERDVAMLMYAPCADELVARAELELLPARLPGVGVHVVYTRPPAGSGLHGHFTSAHLDTAAPDFRERSAYVCGPPALMDAVQEQWASRGIAGRLHRECFGPSAGEARRRDPADVTCERSGRTVRVPGARSLLEELEAAGLQPRHGCRAGLCHQCACVKRSGSVEDVRTGRTSDEREEPIQICVTRACGDLVLAV